MLLSQLLFFYYRRSRLKAGPSPPHLLKQEPNQQHQLNPIAACLSNKSAAGWRPTAKDNSGQSSSASQATRTFRPKVNFVLHIATPKNSLRFFAARAAAVSLP